MDWMFMSPMLKFICWDIYPSVLVSGGGDFGRELGHEAEALMNSLNAIH